MANVHCHVPILTEQEIMLSQLVEVANVAQAAIVIDAMKRKPEEYERQSFFGEYDLWHYIPIFDKKLCDRCLMHARTEYFVGTYLRGLFPYLEIVDANIINANVHPNCRCILTRITDAAEYLMVTKELF